MTASDASAQGGSGAALGLAIYYGRPPTGGGGGIYQRAMNLQPGVPFQPPIGSGLAPRRLVASFQSLDSLIIQYVDNYLQTLPNRDTSGNTSISVTGNDAGRAPTRSPPPSPTTTRRPATRWGPSASTTPTA